MKIAIAGTGYVGLANGLLLAHQHEVVALDIVEDRVAALNARRSPIDDPEVIAFLARPELNFRATSNPEEAYGDAEFVVVATPTNYDPERNFFDTASVESVIADAVRLAPEATIVIKSTIPVGFTEGVKAKLGVDNVFFSPEFLREGRALLTTCTPPAL